MNPSNCRVVSATSVPYRRSVYSRRISYSDITNVAPRRRRILRHRLPYLPRTPNPLKTTAKSTMKTETTITNKWRTGRAKTMRNVAKKKSLKEKSKRFRNKALLSARSSKEPVGGSRTSGQGGHESIHTVLVVSKSLFSLLFPTVTRSQAFTCVCKFDAVGNPRSSTHEGIARVCDVKSTAASLKEQLARLQS